MRRYIGALAAGLVLILVAFAAYAALHEVSVGNYWFEDDATGSREQISVNEGDRIRFTIREAAYPSHDIVIDEYDIDSPSLNIFDTYTTPPLNKPGTFLVYCRAHQARGHETTLVVKAKPSTAPAPEPTASGPAPAPTKKPKATKTTTASPTAGTPTASPSPTESTVPSGVGRSTDRRVPPPDPDSLEGLLGRDLGGDVPWTAALWQAAIAAMPIAGAAGYALRRERRRWRASR